MAVHGDLNNIKHSLILELDNLYDNEIPTDQLVTFEVAEKMLAITAALGREVAVYINRQGKIAQVSVGDNATVDLPGLKQRTGSNRLSGVRCVHTHPSADTRLSAPDISSLRCMRFDVMAAIGLKGKEIYGSIGWLTGQQSEDGTYYVQASRELPLKQLNKIDIVQLVMSVNREIGRHLLKDTEERPERAILAGVGFSSGHDKWNWSPEESLNELEGLVKTAGAEIIGSVLQKKEKPDNAFFLGKGKVDEIAMSAQNLEADLLIIDDEISPSQQRNLELATGLRVIDRTALILDIFAQRARSSAGKLQVELAQLKYNLPRIGGQGLVLSRLGGGIGTRGPGETKLEMDRRKIRSRIHDLEEQLAKLKQQRKIQRSQRKSNNLPMAALVGYTNAGKSTLLNALSGADVLAEDKLFATLDPTTRQVDIDEQEQILLTDTVGFIQKLPHTLVSAFQATLEETTEADLLIHVVDAGNPNYELQIKAVMEVLREIGAADKPSIFVFNKADKLADKLLAEDILHNLPESGSIANRDYTENTVNIAKTDNTRNKVNTDIEDANDSSVKSQGVVALKDIIKFASQRMLQDRNGVVISARTQDGLEELRNKIKDFFAEGRLEMSICIPYDKGGLITELYDLANIHCTEYNEQGTVLTLDIPASEVEKFKQFEI